LVVFDADLVEPLADSFFVVDSFRLILVCHVSSS
jgi:hypothetical protein